jgi:hypothetical protein
VREIKVRVAPRILLAAVRRDLVRRDFGYALHAPEARHLELVQQCEAVSVLTLPWRKFLLPGASDASLALAEALGRPVFLNAPHALMAGAARLAARRGRLGNDTVLLGPVGSGSSWFWDAIWGLSDVHLMRPRVPFEGHRAGHRSDFFAALYPPADPARPRALLWDWKTGERRPLAPPGRLNSRLTEDIRDQLVKAGVEKE